MKKSASDLHGGLIVGFIPDHESASGIYPEVRLGKRVVSALTFS